MFFGLILMPRKEGFEKRKQVFRIILLQFKRFRWIMKIHEKWIQKCHPKSSKIKAAGTQGFDLYDFENCLEAPFFIVS